MKTRYFFNCRDMQELQSRYQNLEHALGIELLQINDPIKLDFMKEYHEVKKGLVESETSHPQKKEPTIQAIIEKIKQFHLPAEICGKWLWITSPNANKYYDDLKLLGFRYSNSKKAFYWRSQQHRSNTTSPIPFEDIRKKYGVKQLAY